MTHKLTADKLEELAREYGVKRTTITDIYAWMEENAELYETCSNLAYDASQEFMTVNDDDLFSEIAFLFEDVVG